MGYDSSAVDTVSVFENPRECLSAGAITIAGPEIPCERSSGRLFGVLREDPNACVVQVVGSGEDPMTDGQCTISDHRVVNHPARETLVDVHDALQPTSTVITHRHGGASGRFNDLDSVVWGSGDTDEYTLYDGRGWLLPPWMGDGPIRRRGSVEPQRLGQFAGDLLGDPALPSIAHREPLDLAAEGLDLERLEGRLTRTPAVASIESPTPDSAASTTAHPPIHISTMPADESDDTANEEQPRQPPSGLVRTTGSNLGDDVDPAAEAALNENELTAADVATAMAARHHQLRDSETATDEGSQSSGLDGEAQGVEPDAPEPPANDRPATESTAESTNGRDTAVDAIADSEAATESDDDATADTEAEPSVAETSADSKPAASEDESTPSEPEDASANRSASSERRVMLTVHPLIVALAERVIGAADEANRDSLEVIFTTAIDRYLAALLAGDATGGSEEVFDLEVTGSEATERALAVLTERDDQATSIAELACLGLATRLTGDTTAEEQSIDLRVSERQLDAVVGNDRFAFETRTAVVETALLRYLDDFLEYQY